MLKKADSQTLATNMNYFYNLSQDLTKSGYPTYTDGIKTKQDFCSKLTAGLSADNEENLLYLYIEDNDIKGIINYFWHKEDKYIQTSVFNIETNFHKALNEFIDYISKEFTGFELFIGCPKENISAVSYLTNNRFELLDDSVNFTLNLESYKIQTLESSTESDIKKISEENYSDFRKVHAATESDMYWNSDRIYADIKNWTIFVYYQQNIPCAAICAMNTSILTEIFSIDFMDMPYNSIIEEQLLKSIMNDCKISSISNICYFAEKESEIAAINAGLNRVGNYVCFSKKM